MKNKRKNKKGFTLIELLAVLVVLAILALITTPIVLNVIKQAREGANKSSADAYIRALDYAVTECLTKNPKKDVNEMTLKKDGTEVLIGNQICSSVEIKGKGIKITGSELGIQLSEHNKITLGNEDTILTIGKYSFRIVEGEKVSIDNNNNNNNNNQTFEKYEIGELVTYNGIDFYVIENGEDDVTLLKTEPLSSLETKEYGSISEYEITVKGPGGITFNYGGTYFNNTNSELFDYDISDIKKIVERWANDKISGYKEVRLLKLDDLGNLGYEFEDGDWWIYTKEDTPEWIVSAGWYWTMDNCFETVYIVDKNGDITAEHTEEHVYSDGLVRPVVVISKSKNIEKN